MFLHFVSRTVMANDKSMVQINTMSYRAMAVKKKALMLFSKKYCTLADLNIIYNLKCPSYTDYQKKI